MEAEKEMVPEGKRSTVLDTETRGKQKHAYEDGPSNADNADVGMELSIVLAPSVNTIPAMPINCIMKRPRGRPRGSGKLQVLSAIGGIVAETAGGKVTSRVMKVPIGVDLAAILTSHFENQRSSHALFIISAKGVVTNVVLHPPGTWAHPMRFEGECEIVHLTGSFKSNEEHSLTHPVGTLTISVATPDGQLVGGIVAGPLIAATPIQVVLGEFEQNILKKYKKKKRHSVASQPDAKENCSTPTTAFPGVGSKEADTVINENESSSPASSHGGDGSAMQGSRWAFKDDEINYSTPTTPILALDTKAADTYGTVNRSYVLVASPLNACEYDPLGEWQPGTVPMSPLLEIEYKDPDIALDDTQSFTPAPPPTVGEYPLLEWQPPSNQTTAPDTDASPSIHEK